MKPRTVEVTLRFDSIASLRCLRSYATWAVQLRLAREFFRGQKVCEAGMVAMQTDHRTVHSVRAHVVPQKPKARKVKK